MTGIHILARRLYHLRLTSVQFLQSHPAFEEYLDLLNVLEEQLSSASDSDGQRVSFGSSTQSSGPS